MKKYTLLGILIVAVNMSFGQKKLYDSLRYQLFLIDRDDQDPRMESDSIRKQWAGDSMMLKRLLNENNKVIHFNDSVNQIKVRSLIDKYGWLGPNEIGDDGASTLFLVIQHADLKTQEKYLPVLRAAVQNGRAKASRLALLEDRVALREGKKQIYGSQLYLNVITNDAYVLPLEDPDHVDQRRAKVGLQSMANYMQDNFNVTWDLSKYYKDLPIADSLLKTNPF